MKNLSVELIIEAKDRASAVVKTLSSAFGGLSDKARDITSSLAQGAAGLEKVKSSAAQSAASLEKVKSSATQSAAGMEKIKASADRTTSAYREQRTAAEKAGRAGKESFSGIRTAVDNTRTGVFNLRTALIGLTGVLSGLGLGMLGHHALETASSFEQLEKQLDTLTKGSGKETLKELNDWAMEMPVNTQSAISTFKQMQAYGLDPTIEKLEILVDVSTLFGEEAMTGVARALGQMQTLGKVSAEELNQLSEAGINARKYLRDAFGMTVEEIQASGMEIEAVIAAIMDGMQNEFGGAARSSQDAWKGLTNSVVSYWTELERAVMDAGMFDWLKEKTRNLVAWFKEWRESGDMAAWAKKTAHVLTKVGDVIIAVTSAVGRFLAEWGKVLAIAAGAAAFVASVKAASGALLGMAGVAMSLASGIGGVVSALITASAVMKVTLAGAAIAAVIAVGQLIRKFNELRSISQDKVALEKLPLEQVQELINALNKRYNLEIKTYEDILRLEREKILAQDEETGAWRKIGSAMGEVKTQTRLTKKEWTALKTAMAGVGREYAGLRSDAAEYYDYQIARIKALETNEDRAAASIISLQSAKYLELIRLATKEANEKLDLLKQGQNDEARYAKEAGEVHKQLKEVKLEVLEEWAENLEEAVATSMEMERKYADEVRQLQKDIAAAKMSTAEKLKELDRKLMSPGERWEDERREAVELLAAAEKALAEGTEEGMAAARELAERAQEKFADLGEEVTDGETTVVSLKDAVETAKEGTEAAGKVMVEAMREQKDQAKEAGAAWKAFGETAQAELSSVKDQMDKLSTTGINPKVEVDDSELTDIENRIAKLDGKPINIKVNEVPQKATGGLVYDPRPAGYADGGGVFARLAAPYISRGSGTRDDVPAMLTRGEFVQTVAATRHYGLDVMYALRDRRIPREALTQYLASGGPVGGVGYYADGGEVGSRLSAALKQSANMWSPDLIVQAVLDEVASAFQGHVANISAVPATYTERAEGLLARVSTVFAEAAVNPSSDSLASNAQKQLTAERELLRSDSVEQASLAREAGLTEAADMIEVFQANLDALLVELQNALDEVRQDYLTAVAELETERDEALAEARDSYKDAVAEASSSSATGAVDSELLEGLAYARQAQKNKQSAGFSAERERAAANTYAAAISQARQGKLSEEQIDLYKKAAWASDRERAVYMAQIAAERQSASAAKGKAKMAAMGEMHEAVSAAQRAYLTGQDMAKRKMAGDVKAVRAETISDGRELYADSAADLRSSLLDMIQDLRDQLMDARKSLFDLTKSYATNIGMGQWLEGDEEGYARGGVVGRILRFARGGMVPLVEGARRGADSVLSWLTPEEGVITAPRARMMGEGVINFINHGPLDAVKDFLAGGALAFADGGVVPEGGAPTTWSGELTLRQGRQSATVHGEPATLDNVVSMLRKLEAAT